MLIPIGALGYKTYTAGQEDELADIGDDYDLEPPKIKESIFGPLAAWRHERKRRKLAGKGYVQWYLIGSSWPRPKFVKPKDEGGGEFEFEHDGETYLFPREAFLPTEDAGLWTVVHQRGDAEPIDLTEPDEFSISAKQLQNYVTSRVTVEPPGWLSSLSSDPKTLIKYAIFGFIAFVLLQGALEGGIMP
jgi:hypothetical protein